VVAEGCCTSSGAAATGNTARLASIITEAVITAVSFRIIISSSVFMAF
jgi:hypothetical protein